MTTVRVACEAMATRFEMVLHGAHEPALRAAGEEAVEEIHRLEALLSFYRPTSVVAEVNRAAGERPIPVPPEVFRLLEHALLLSRATDGAFDITVAPLMRAWGLVHGEGRLPTDLEVEEARGRVGADLVELDEARHTVRFRRPGVTVDLGAIGKGYAIDRAAEILRDNGVESALLHGGTSSTLAIGRPPAHEGDPDPVWRLAIAPPVAGGPPPPPGVGGTAHLPLAVVELRDESISVSAVWGKGFEANGRFYGHVLDPRSGRPVHGALLSAMVLPSATESDAVSTALLVRGAEMVERLRAPGAPGRCLVLEPVAEPPGYRVVTNGISATAR